MRAALVGLGAAAATWLALVVVLIVAGRRARAKEILGLIPNIVALLRALLRDRRVPRASKVAAAVALAWIVSPIDLIPEFLPIVGPLDDAIVAVLVLRHLVRRAGAGVVREHWRGGPESLRVLLRLAGEPPAGRR